MDLWDLKVGDIIRIQPGYDAQVTAPTEDGEWIAVIFYANDDPEPQPDLVSADEVIGLAQNPDCG